MKKIPFIADMLATGFYTGKIPFMPGTFGSLVAIPFGYLASLMAMPYKIVLFLVIFFLGVWVSNIYEKYSGLQDPGCVVIDEVAALLLLYIIFPFNLFYVICGFLLFRVFDIIKPFPIKYLENLPGGWGIMADDIGAAVYATIGCIIIKYLVEIF